MFVAFSAVTHALHKIVEIDDNAQTFAVFVTANTRNKFTGTSTKEIFKVTEKTTYFVGGNKGSWADLKKGLWVRVVFERDPRSNSYLVPSRQENRAVPQLIADTVYISTEPSPFAQQKDTAAPPDSERAKQIVTLVEKASALIDSKGRSIFPEFRKGEWLTGGTYVFVDDLKGAVLFNGGFPLREGSNSSRWLFWAEFLKVIQSKGSGWVDYMTPKPGQSGPSQKWSYIKAVNIDGTPGLAGAGFYPQ
jgi:cytochrome c